MCECKDYWRKFEVFHNSNQNALNLKYELKNVWNLNQNIFVDYDDFFYVSSRMFVNIYSLIKSITSVKRIMQSYDQLNLNYYEKIKCKKKY